ncbi:MAG TPA: cytochrome d ubiquinol oxidase subunit II, partial [Hyphomicrobiales bacterium]|nr:cytochrome d ubiquinol oxidase subunit II [Hyphomicrobiales bacterium]
MIFDAPFDLAFAWGVIIAFGVYAYVVLDGFDLGVGVLFLAIRDAEKRDTMVNSIAPVWDGNETWLVLGGAGLLAAFPLAYAVVLPALYAPLIIMLMGLIFRGVAVEFRFKTKRWKPFWDLGFAAGSIAAALCQGIALGAFIQGIAIEGRAYAGGWWDWLTPFSLMTGMALIVGYALLGATWLIMKTEGGLQERCYWLSWPLGGAVVALIGLVSIWTPLAEPAIAERWFSWPNIILLSPVPLLVAATGIGLHRSLKVRHEYWPFLFALALFTLSFIGLGISLYPHIIPPSVTIWEAAAPQSSLAFTFVGAVV